AASGAASVAPAAGARLGLADPVAGRKGLVAGQHMVPLAAGAGMAEARLVRAAPRDRHAMGGVHVGDPVGFHLVADRALQLVMHALEESLALAEAPVLGIEPAIDEIRHAPVPRFGMASRPC